MRLGVIMYRYVLSRALGVRGLSRAVAALGFLTATFAGGPAQAGLVQLNPLSYLQMIFDQPSIMAATGGAGITVNIEAPQVVVSKISNVATSDDLLSLGQAAGVGLGSGSKSKSIPIFYIDSYNSNGVAGLAWLGGPGVTVRTSFQQDLQIHRAGDGYDPLCQCVRRLPAVTAADVPLGWLSSAEIVAHEIGHNLGLSHVDYPDLMRSYVDPYNLQTTSSYYLDSGQVSTILQSSLVQKQGGLYSIDIIPFSVLSSLPPILSGVPEPASWAMMVGGFGLIGVAMRRRKVAVSFA
jgi:hypothetical protein